MKDWNLTESLLFMIIHINRKKKKFGYGNKNRHIPWWKRISSPERNSHIYSQYHLWKLNGNRVVFSVNSVEKTVCVYVCVYAVVLSCSVVFNSLRPPGLYPTGSSVHGISKVRILEWVAIFSSRGPSWPRDQTCVSCISCIGKRILYYWATSMSSFHL